MPRSKAVQARCNEASGSVVKHTGSVQQGAHSRVRTAGCVQQGAHSRVRTAGCVQQGPHSRVRTAGCVHQGAHSRLRTAGCIQQGAYSRCAHTFSPVSWAPFGGCRAARAGLTELPAGRWPGGYRSRSSPGTLQRTGPRQTQTASGAQRGRGSRAGGTPCAATRGARGWTLG
jgi:hypothetical protein